ncbi:hypothetical protein F8388_001239 [Cannabis sativa]|uniref:Uncharacterized protein n=1 Tax=Cannabis sativa TaxID=3483 RepID=A0A7J6GGP9_CANSA|nr:hypothetical protein F8388_001239 [Cannabis sativa]
MALMGGFARIGNNEITVLVNDAEKGSDIDPQEAQQTLEIAEDEKYTKSIKANEYKNSLYTTFQGAGTSILTLLGGFHPQTQSLWLTDIAHHHLAIAFIFLIAGHMYRTNFGIRHSLALASLGVITSLVAQHMYSLPTYAFIAQDITTQAALYTHHQYIAGFIMT